MTPEEIASSLRQGIRDKVLLPGTAINQSDLAQRFGVSRNPVREALRMLVADGLVEMKWGEGATVRQLSPDDLEEIYNARIALEPLMAQFIIAEVRQRDIDSLSKLAHRINEEPTVSNWLRLNFDFHAKLYELANKPRTAQILLTLLTSVQPYSLENIDRLEGRPQANDEHIQMIKALTDKDAKLLGTLFRTHLTSAKIRLLEHYRELEKEIKPLMQLV